VVAGTALKELESDKGIIIRYVIGRRCVSVFFLLCDRLILNKFVSFSFSEYIPYTCNV
jgi:hypothetical protein